MVKMSKKVPAKGKKSKKRDSNRGPAPTPSTLLMLCARSGGRCEFEGCNKYLFRDEITLQDLNKSNVAHIVASSPDGPRGDPKRSHELSDEIENLMLVCLDHHELIDKKKYVPLYPEDRLLGMKHKHERNMELVGESLNHDPSHLLFFTSKIKGTQSATISTAQAVSAILSENRPAKAEPDCIRVECAHEYHEPAFWSEAAKSLKKQFLERVDNIVVQDPQTHFSVFPLAPIPLIVQLGYLMGDKIQSTVYQRRHHHDIWDWQPHNSGSSFILCQFPPRRKGRNAALLVSLSSAKSDSERNRFAAAVNAKYVYEIQATNPGVDCIASKEDLSNFWHVYQMVMDRICSSHPEVKEISVLPIVPVSAAFEMGRRFMPGVHPKLHIYDFSGDFIKTLTIGDKSND